MVIIGGGYTGMWTAWHLLDSEPGIRVLLLEGGVCGHGPSGRNGGFCESLWFSAPTLRERFGDEPARRLLDASSETVTAIGAWCEDNGVDAWFDQSGYLCASTGEAFDDVGLDAVEAARELGKPEAVQDMSPAQVRARVDSPVFRRGVLVPDFATVQPARLALGLRNRLLERGVEIFEGSRVVSLDASTPREVVVRTPGGSVRASAAVLAVGPSARSFRPLRSRLSVTSSHIVLTEPVPDVLEQIGWTGGECITDGRTLLHYFRTTRDGRILLGWGGGRPAYGARLHGRVEVDPQAAESAHGALVRLFPQLEGRRITHAWGGPIDVSPSHLPIIVPVGSDRVFGVFGYTGNGVGPSLMMGRTAASLALDRRDEHAELALVDPAPRRVPTGLTSWLGGSAIRAGLVSKEAAEENGSVAGWLSRGLAAIPERIGFHIGR